MFEILLQSIILSNEEERGGRPVVQQLCLVSLMKKVYRSLAKVSFKKLLNLL